MDSEGGMMLFGVIFWILVIVGIVFFIKWLFALRPKKSKIEDEKIWFSDKTEEDTRKCPNCGGTLTEINFFKLKSGNDTKCDYCNVIISRH